MEKKEKCMRVIRSVVFFVVLALLLNYCGMVMMRKTESLTERIQNRPDNAYDVIFYGSSHAFCGINPMVLWREQGITSFVYASPGQPIFTSYHYMKESLQNQKPKVMVLDLYGLRESYEYPSEWTAYHAVDAFPTSINKFQMIQNLAPPEQRKNYYFSLMKYHTRWKELTNGDFDLSYRDAVSEFQGYILYTEKCPQILEPISYEDVKPAEITDKNRKYLNAMIDLAEQEGIELVFLIVPYPPTEDELGRYKTAYQLAQERGIRMLDLNLAYEELGFDEPGYFCDSDHLNYLGAEQAGRYLAEYLKEQFDLADHRGEDGYHQWEKDLDVYERILNSQPESA